MDVPQPLAWSADEVARYWDYWSGRDDAQETYFALQVGDGVVRFAEHVKPLAGLQILDFGSGPGYLIPHLLKRGANVSATDFSPNSIAEVEQRFHGSKAWCDARLFDNRQLPWEANSFDAAFCLETIEHLHQEDCTRIFQEIFRILRPGGFVVFTTPNEEKLERQQVFCPSCNCEFHRWQHLRSWSAEQLSTQLQGQGYEVSFCRGLDFRNFQPSPDSRVRLSSAKRLVRSAIWKSLDWILPRPFPHERGFRQRLRKSDGHHLAAVAFKPIAKANAA